MQANPKRRLRPQYSTETAISRYSKQAKTLLGPPIPGTEHHLNNAPLYRARRARGSILKLVELTGEPPLMVAVRLGLTDEQIARLDPFRHKVIWY